MLTNRDIDALIGQVGYGTEKMDAIVLGKLFKEDLFSERLLSIAMNLFASANCDINHLRAVVEKMKEPYERGETGKLSIVMDMLKLKQETRLCTAKDRAELFEEIKEYLLDKIHENMDYID